MEPKASTCRWSQKNGSASSIHPFFCDIDLVFGSTKCWSQSDMLRVRTPRRPLLLPCNTDWENFHCFVCRQQWSQKHPLAAFILSSVTLTWCFAAQSGGAKVTCSESGPQRCLCFFHATLIVRTFTAFSADNNGAKRIHLQMEPKEWFSVWHSAFLL